MISDWSRMSESVCWKVCLCVHVSVHEQHLNLCPSVCLNVSLLCSRVFQFIKPESRGHAKVGMKSECNYASMNQRGSNKDQLRVVWLLKFHLKKTAALLCWGSKLISCILNGRTWKENRTNTRLKKNSRRSSKLRDYRSRRMLLLHPNRPELPW